MQLLKPNPFLLSKHVGWGQGELRNQTTEVESQKTEKQKSFIPPFHFHPHHHPATAAKSLAMPRNGSVRGGAGSLSAGPTAPRAAATRASAPPGPPASKAGSTVVGRLVGAAGPAAKSASVTVAAGAGAGANAGAGAAAGTPPWRWFGAAAAPACCARLPCAGGGAGRPAVTAARSSRAKQTRRTIGESEEPCCFFRHPPSATPTHTCPKKK